MHTYRVTYYLLQDPTRRTLCFVATDRDEALTMLERNYAAQADIIILCFETLPDVTA